MPFALWGSATLQGWLDQLGLAYYGCCEPLHNKIAFLESILNLRKITISKCPDAAASAELKRSRRVMSLKPSPEVA